MIIRSVRAEGFGCFAEPVEIQRFSDGVNLLFAPNGTGKSTLVRALTMALMDGHRVRAAEAMKWRTWGRSLPPRVVVEFEHANHEYRIDKRFLDGAYSTLSRKEAGAWRPFMAGDDADEFVRKDVLGCTPPGSGVAQQKNWGLAQVLWTSQGDLALPPLTDNVVAAVRQSVGATLTESSSVVEARIRAAYLEVFTETGRMRRGANEAPIAAWKRRRDELAGGARALADELAAFERLSEQIATLGTAVESARARSAACARERDAEAERAGQYKSLVSERDAQEQRQKGLQAVCSERKARIQAIADAKALLRTLGEELARLKEEAPGLDKRRQELARLAEQAEAAVSAARTTEQAAREDARVVQIAREYAQARQQASDWASRSKRVAGLDIDIARLNTEISAIVTPTATELGRIRRLAVDARSASERLAMARVNAAIEPANAAVVRVIEGEHPGNVTLTPGSTVSVAGAPNLTLDVPGLGRVRITGPAADYDSVCRELETAEAGLREATARFGTDDPDALEERRNSRALLDAALKAKQAERAGLLGNEPVEWMAERAAECAARIAVIEAQHPDWSQNPPESEALERAARERVDACAAATLAADSRYKTAVAELNQAELAFQEAGLNIAATESRITGVQADLASRTADGQTDEQRAAALETALLEFDAARAHLKDAERELSAFPTDPARRVAMLEAQVQQASKQFESLREQLLRAETQIEAVAVASPYDRLNRATEDLAVLDEQIDREQLRMDAVALLHATISEVRGEMLAAVTGPVQAAATTLLSELCGRDFANIRLTAGLSPDHVVPVALAGSDEQVEANRLSGGEKEQVYFCTRLAIAKEIARSERQLLILDDVLTFTDDTRLARICEALSREASRLQILLLTCHPERFYAIRDAALFDLQRMLDRAVVGAGGAGRG